MENYVRGILKNTSKLQKKFNSHPETTRMSVVLFALQLLRYAKHDFLYVNFLHLDGPNSHGGQSRKQFLIRIQ